MNQEVQTLFDKMTHTLEEQVKAYRQLLEVVRKEKEILISADLDDLNDNNKLKETMLLKMRQLEATRMRYAAEISQHLGLDPEHPRLLDIASKLDGPDADRLRHLHSVLELLLRRVHEYNKKNEKLVQSALEKITGAMKAIRDTLQDKPTYQRKGDVESKPARSGHLVSKEV